MSCDGLTWTTAEGKQIVLHDMDDHHLVNTYLYVEGQEHTMQGALSMLHGEMAVLFAEQDAAEIDGIAEQLRLELDRRDIDPYFGVRTLKVTVR